MALEDWCGIGTVDGSSEVGWEGMGGVSERVFRSATASRAGGSISRRDIDRSDGGSLWPEFAILAVVAVVFSLLLLLLALVATPSHRALVHLKDDSEGAER